MYTKMYHYIYIIVNVRRNMLYVGKHSTRNLEDGYFGSGTELNYQIQKYGSKEFTRYIIDFTDTEQHLIELEKYYIRYFYEKFQGVLLNIDIPKTQVNSFIKASFLYRIPFWERSYAFLYLLNSYDDVPRQFMLGTFFITGIFDEGRKDICGRVYDWKNKNMLFLGQLKLESKFDFQKQDFQWYFTDCERGNTRRLQQLIPYYLVEIPEIKIKLNMEKFSFENFTGYFRKIQDKL